MGKLTELSCADLSALMSHDFPPLIACTRFSDATVEENRRWRDNNQDAGCIYGVSRPIKKSIPSRAWIYVVEMNNTGRGRIEGIGLIRNINRNNRTHKIYSDHNYNLEIYRGEHRVSRAELLAHSEWSHDTRVFRDRQDPGEWLEVLERTPGENSLLGKLENRLFRGKGHLKRGWGITLLPAAITSCDRLALAHNITLAFKYKYAHISE